LRCATRSKSWIFSPRTNPIRDGLLDSLSHDLRTPLSIADAAT